MITLSATNHSVDVTMTATTTNAVEYVVAYADITLTTFTPIGANASISAAGPTTLIAAPAASTQRQIKYISAFNADTVANTQTFQFNVGGTRRTLFKATLQPGESVLYMNDLGWSVYNAIGAKKLVAGDVVGPSSATDNAIARFDLATGKLIQNSLVTVDDSGNIATAGTVDGVDVGNLPYVSLGDSVQLRNMFLQLSDVVSAPISGSAHWQFIGLVMRAFTPRKVRFYLEGNGAGAQTAEVGLFSTTGPPDGTLLTLTKIVATGTITALTAGAPKFAENTADFATLIPVGTYLWAGMRTAMATTQPNVLWTTGDVDAGTRQLLTGAAAFTTAGPWVPNTAHAVAAGDFDLNVGVAPEIRVLR